METKDQDPRPEFRAPGRRRPVPRARPWAACAACGLPWEEHDDYGCDGYRDRPLDRFHARVLAACLKIQGAGQYPSPARLRAELGPGNSYHYLRARDFLDQVRLITLGPPRRPRGKHRPSDDETEAAILEYLAARGEPAPTMDIVRALNGGKCETVTRRVLTQMAAAGTLLKIASHITTTARRPKSADPAALMYQTHKTTVYIIAEES